jgi:HEAT repeat protein
MIFYCPACWSEIDERDMTCRDCGADIIALDRRSYEEKLIAALSHQEPTVPLRAAWLLGRLQVREAVPALVALARRAPDPYIQAAAVEALGQIGDPSVRPMLADLAEHGPVLVRGKAHEGLRRLAGLGKTDS